MKWGNRMEDKEINLRSNEGKNKKATRRKRIFKSWEQKRREYVRKRQREKEKARGKKNKETMSRYFSIEKRRTSRTGVKEREKKIRKC